VVVGVWEGGDAGGRGCWWEGGLRVVGCGMGGEEVVWRGVQSRVSGKSGARKGKWLLDSLLSEGLRDGLGKVCRDSIAR